MTVHSSTEMPAAGIRRRYMLMDGLVRAALFTALWWILTRGATDSWVVGIPCIIGATMLSVRIVPHLPWRLTLSGLFRFGRYFLFNSLKSSVDVASRVMRPTVDVNPGIVEYPLTLTDVHMRVIMANTISLLPGTLSVDLRDDVVVVHALDVSLPVAEDLYVLERAIARIYGISLPKEPAWTRSTP